jgi:hypothetical protein
MSDKKLKAILEKMGSRLSEEEKKDEDEEINIAFEKMLDQMDSKESENLNSKEQLPIWPRATMGVPNAVLRSSLFGVIQRGRRKYIDGQELTSIGSIKIIYTGPRLDQADLDVWEQCLTLAREEGLGSRIEFSANSFLKCIDRKTGKSQHEWLKKAFRRLSGSVVSIIDGDREYFGPLIAGGARDEETGRYVIEINPRIRKLYGDQHWTQVQWSERHALKKPLSQWLHGFYSSHRNPYPIKTETIRSLCGSETKDIYRFRQSLRAALKELQGITGWHCSVDKENKVQVVRGGVRHSK